MSDLPDFLLPPEEPPESPDAQAPSWQGFLLIYALHALSIFIAALVSPKTLWAFIFFGIPFVQLLYVLPCLLIFSNQKKKRLVKGVLFAMLLTFLPLAAVILLAIAGFALCSVILFGAGALNHH